MLTGTFCGSFLAVLTCSNLDDKIHSYDYESIIFKIIGLFLFYILWPSKSESHIIPNLVVSTLLSYDKSDNRYWHRFSSLVFGIILNHRFKRSFSSGELVLLSQLTTELLQSGWPSFFLLLNTFPLIISHRVSLVSAGAWIVLSASATLNKQIFFDLIHCILSNLVLLLYWVVILSITLFLSFISPFQDQNSLRKFYHFVSVFLFVPAAFISLPLLKIAFAVAATLFIYIETFRHSFKSWKYTDYLEKFMEKCRNELDRGDMILSHLYLLLGCAMPFWFSPNDKLSLSSFSGVISLGIGDSLASIGGRRFGKTRWHQNTRKTIEGSLTGCIGMFISWIILNNQLSNGSKTAWPKLLAISIASSLWEALTDLNDNLTLPLFTFNLIKSL